VNYLKIGGMGVLKSHHYSQMGLLLGLKLLIMIKSLKLSSLKVFGAPLDSLGHLGMLDILKKIETWPSKHTLWKNPTFG